GSRRRTKCLHDLVAIGRTAGIEPFEAEIVLEEFRELRLILDDDHQRLAISGQLRTGHGPAGDAHEVALLLERGDAGARLARRGVERALRWREARKRAADEVERAVVNRRGRLDVAEREQ